MKAVYSQISGYSCMLLLHVGIGSILDNSYFSMSNMIFWLELTQDLLSLISLFFYFAYEYLDKLYKI